MGVKYQIKLSLRKGKPVVTERRSDRTLAISGADALWNTVYREVILIMTRGKSIKLFLMDDVAGGRMKCSLANWNGVAYKVPRTLLGRCKDMDILKQSGVYLLFGTDKEENPVVYVGQAGSRKNGQGLLYRIQEPHSSIDYWTEAVMITTTNNSLGPTEISYLENRFCNMAKNAGRYKAVNGNDPNPGNPSEETVSEMEDFIDYTALVVGVLGYKVFEPSKVSSIDGTDSSNPLLYMEYKGYRATGQRTAEGFVVFKDSQLNPDTTNSCPEYVKRNRNTHREKISDKYQLLADVPLSSPSAAACFVGGASLNGNTQWKNEAGVTLDKLEFPSNAPQELTKL